MPSSNQKASAERSSGQITSPASQLPSPYGTLHLTRVSNLQKVLPLYTLIIQNYRLRAGVNQPWLYKLSS